MAVTLSISLGPFLVIVLLIAELVINPLKNLFKDELLYCGARHVVGRGKEVRVRITPKLFHAAGFEAFTSGGILMLFMNAINVTVPIFLIVATILWERTIEQKTIQMTVPVTTTAQFDGSLRAPNGKAYLMSPFPVIGLTEETVGHLSPFSRNGTDSDGHYRVMENVEMANKYASACIQTPNSTHTVVNMAAVIVDHDGETRTSCLDGSGTSSLYIAATFSNAPGNLGRDVSRIKLLREISTDNLTTLYAGQVRDAVGRRYKGYIAYTGKSYFNANAEWSFYGLLRQVNGSNEIWRLSLPLSYDNPPCYRNKVGTWRLSKREFKCPTGKTKGRFKDPREVATKPLQSAELSLMSRQNETQENADLLAWMVETDYARFWAAQTFSQELRERIRSDRMFYSAYDGERVIATDGSTQETVSFGKVETVLVAVAVSLLLLQILVGNLWKCFQARKYNIYSEIVSYKAIAAMYQSKVSGKPIEEKRNTQLRLGICNDDEQTRQIGIVSKGDERLGQLEAFWDPGRAV